MIYDISGGSGTVLGSPESDLGQNRKKKTDLGQNRKKCDLGQNRKVKRRIRKPAGTKGEHGGGEEEGGRK